jgi:hypothetical protein
MSSQINNIENPIIKTYHFPAFVLSIMQNEVESYDWIYSNYIQTCFQKETDPIPFYYFIFDINLSPWIMVEKKAFVELNRDNIIDFIKEKILAKGYIRLSMDQYFVPEKEAYQKQHYNHDDLIYGFNDDQEIFYLFGYTKNKIMERTEISFSNLIDGVLNVNKNFYYLESIEIFYLNDKCTYKMKKDYIRQELQRYIEGYCATNDFDWFQNYDERSWGIQTYDSIIQCFDGVMERNDYYLNSYDKVIAFFFEEKNVMIKRLEYLSLKFEINFDDELSKYNEILEISYYFRNYFMNISNYKVEQRNIFIQICSFCKMEEEYVLKSVIGKLK